MTALEPITTTETITPMPWEQFRAEVLSLYGPRLRAVATRRAMEHALNILEQLGVKSTADFTVPLIARLVESRPVDQSAHTVKGLLRQVKVAISYAAKAGYVARDPFMVRPVKSWVRAAPPTGKKHLTRVEIKAILDLMAKDCEERQGWALWRSRRLYALTALIAYCGLRKTEALFLRVEDIDLEARVIRIVDRAEHRTKTAGSAEPVVFPEALLPILTMWLEHRTDAPPAFFRTESSWVFPAIRTPTPWVSGGPGLNPLDRLKSVARRAGVEGVNFHALRRSIATHLELHGAGPAMIQRLLRHTNPQTTETWYRKADVANMRRAVEGFTY